ncbi:Pentacotripeptide-repeat region of PRORP domain-containing protein [Plasmodiophora brassicae]
MEVFVQRQWVAGVRRAAPTMPDHVLFEQACRVREFAPAPTLSTLRLLGDVLFGRGPEHLLRWSVHNRDLKAGRHVDLVRHQLRLLADAGDSGACRRVIAFAGDPVLERCHAHELLRCLSGQRDPGVCREWFDEMVRRGVRTNATTYAHLIRAFRDDVDTCRAFFAEALKDRRHPRVRQAYNALLRVLVGRQDLQAAEDLYADMNARGIPADVDGLDIIMRALAVTGRTLLATQLWERRKALADANRKRAALS